MQSAVNRRAPLGVVALLVFASLSGAGCATVQGPPDPQDPWEGFNRGVFEFNQSIDKAVVKPVAEFYQKVTPDPVDRSITNFFNNLNDVIVALNNLLQLKIEPAVSDVGRIVANSTFGVFGLFDVATRFGLEKHDEDFGQTLGYWGMEPGPYVMLPLLGPSTVRDTVGRAGDFVVSPLGEFDETTRWAMRGVNVIDTRADLLSVSRIAETAALDEYVFIRDAFLQRRRYLVFDGNPPPLPFDEE
jgi:phospholipid-binding lipoprotein MlaA